MQDRQEWKWNEQDGQSSCEGLRELERVFCSFAFMGNDPHSIEMY